MVNNSIKDNLTKDSIVSMIKLSLGADVNKEKVHIVVEGEDDFKFLKRYLNSNVLIYESFSGKNGVEEIIQSTNIDSSRVIGIRDKDYCNDIKNDKIFFYDRCCLEMMITEFDGAFNGVYCEFYKGKMELHELKKHILIELLKVSQLRKYNEENEENNAGINFNGLSFQSIINDELKMDEKNLIEQLRRLNPNKSINLYDTFHKELAQDDMLDITNGHDFISLFKIICDRIDSKNSPNQKNISSVLRSSFNEDFLRKTHLYRKISEYFDDKITVWNC